MGKRKIERGSDEFQFFTDFFQFRQEFRVPEPKDSDYWEQAVNTAGDIISKYEGTSFHGFVQRIMLTCLEDLELMYKDKVEKGVLKE